MAYGNLAYCYHLRDEFAEFASFSRIHWKKKWKIGLKIACGNLGYYSLVVWMLRIYPVFLEFTDQMENRGKDGIWELSILPSLAGWIRRIYPVYLEYYEKKSIENRVEDWIWQPRIYSIWRMNSQILPRYSIEFSEKKWEIGVKIAYGNFGYYLLVAWMLRIYLFFF